MAGAGWGQLVDGAGEAVSYDRLSGGSSVTGFPKTVDAVCSIESVDNRAYDDGMAEKSVLRVLVRQADIGSVPQIDDDRVTHDGVVYSVRTRAQSAGVWELICESVGIVERGARGYRMNR